MFPESAKPKQSAPDDKQPTKVLEKEVRDMVNTITHHIADFHKPGGIGTQHLHHYQSGEEEQHGHGASIITLAGTNIGANMRSELGEKLSSSHENEQEQEHEHDHENDEGDPAGPYVNSNYQAVNNSIMMSSSYSSNDPGVHLDISDVFDHPHSEFMPEKYSHKKQNGKKKDKQVFQADERSAAYSD